MEWDNTKLIEEMLKLRREEAVCWALPTCRISLVTKMAESPKQALDFLHELGVRAKPYASGISRSYGIRSQRTWHGPLEVWDLAYVSEKLRLARYAFSDQEVKHIFRRPLCCPACSGGRVDLRHSLKLRMPRPGIRMCVFLRSPIVRVVRWPVLSDLYAGIPSEAALDGFRH